MAADKLKTQSDPTRKAQLQNIQGKVAIANGKLTYEAYEKIFSTPRWKALAAKGAQTQRVLWASTSTKNKNYRDVLYVEELIGPDSNTLCLLCNQSSCYNYPGMDWVYHTLTAHLGNIGSNLAYLLEFSVLFGKILFFIFFYMWVRWTVPRFRYDQLMNLGWKILIPLSIVNILITGGVILWRIG